LSASTGQATGSFRGASNERTAIRNSHFAAVPAYIQILRHRANDNYDHGGSMTCRFCQPWGKDKKAVTGRPSCKFYELSCEAPICPLDPASFKGIWYPGEDICRSRSHGNLLWIQTQRKLEKISADGYFTMEMLGRDCILKSGIQGLDPDKEERLQLQAWMRKHPKKRAVTVEEHAVIKERLKKCRSFQGNDSF
jgi:hypothetical protein